MTIKLIVFLLINIEIIYSIKVSGNFFIEDWEGFLQPAKDFVIEIMDYDPIFSDDRLAIEFLDGNGYFETEVPSGSDVYIRMKSLVVPDGGQYVIKSNSSATDIDYPFDNTYEEVTSTNNNLNADKYLGAFRVNSDFPLDVEAFRIIWTMRQGTDFILGNTGLRPKNHGNNPEVPNVVVVYPAMGNNHFDDDGECYDLVLPICPISSNPFILITRDAAQNSDGAVPLHEYGHWLMYFSMNKFLPGPPVPGGHGLGDITNGGFAYAEGWPTFFQSMVRKGHSGFSKKNEDYNWVRRDGTTFNLENGKNSPFNLFETADFWNEGETVEGRVIMSFIDLTDSEVDGYDYANYGIEVFKKSWEIMQNNQIDGFDEFWNNFKSTVPSPDLSITALAALKQNTIIYEDINNYLFVPTEYTTINNAVFVATSGKSIFVFPDTYSLSANATLPSSGSLFLSDAILNLNGHVLMWDNSVSDVNLSGTSKIVPRILASKGFIYEYHPTISSAYSIVPDAVSLGIDNYELESDLVVPSNSTLGIHKGANLLFKNGQKMLVNGFLAVDGAATSKVVFKSDRSGGGLKGDWAGIQFINTQAARLSFCEIRDATFPILVSHSNDVIVENSEIHSNLQYVSLQESAIRFCFNRVHDQLYGIRSVIQENLASNDNVIYGNIFYNLDIGCSEQDFDTANVNQQNNLIQHNTFFNNGIGITGALTNVSVLNNVIDDNGLANGAGMRFNGIDQLTQDNLFTLKNNVIKTSSSKKINFIDLFPQFPPNLNNDANFFDSKYNTVNADPPGFPFNKFTSDPIFTSQAPMAFNLISGSPANNYPAIGKIASHLGAGKCPINADMARVGSSITVSWHHSIFSDIVSYNIYLSHTKNGPYALIGNVQAPTDSFIDVSAAQPNIYFYVVTGIDSLGQETEFSKEMVAVIPVLKTISFGETGSTTYNDLTFDTHLRQVQPTRNYGVVDNIRVKNLTNDEWRGLLKFDFRPGLLKEGVRDTSEITSALITLKLSQSEDTQTGICIFTG